MIIRVTRRKINLWLAVMMAIAICVGLLFRDAFGIGVSKYIFLAFAAVPIFLLDVWQMAIFVSMLIPLLVGLPGNYISACVLARLGAELLLGRVKCNTSVLLLSACVMVYVLCQSWMYGQMAVYNIMGAFDFVVLALLVIVILRSDMSANAILAYLVGVIMVGIIMLTTTLQYIPLEGLMNSSTRLGDTDMLYALTGSDIVVTMDPNFYGMNVMAALSSSAQILNTQRGNRRLRAAIILLDSVAIVLALLGLSRAYVVVAAVWCLLFLFSQKNLKGLLNVSLLAIVGAVLLVSLFPMVLDGVLMRFYEGDIIDGNGRLTLIAEGYAQWVENFVTVVFGVGLYNCQTHCTPLLYLFGVGAIGFVLVALWFMRIVWLANRHGSKDGIRRWYPLLATFALFSAVPSAGAVNYTYPMIVPILALGMRKDEKVGSH